MEKCNCGRETMRCEDVGLDYETDDCDSYIVDSKRKRIYPVPKNKRKYVFCPDCGPVEVGLEND